MCERLTLKDKLKCNGGEGCCVYRKPDTVPYYDKPDHAAKSLVNQPEHRKHKSKSPPTG